MSVDIVIFHVPLQLGEIHHAPGAEPVIAAALVKKR